jgi:MerR family transcriptional regulator/heat shock protein HspR
MAKRSDQGRPDDLGVYIISVAAELAGVHPQTLRIYERRGLLRPSRTAGNTRRYSERDIARLRTIQRLTQEYGINLAGVKMIVQLENELDRTRRQVEAMSRELERTRRRLREEVDRQRREGRPGPLVLLRSVPKMPWEVSS